MPTPVESLLEVYEDMVEDLLVLEIFLAKDLLYGVSSCFEACLFFSFDFFFSACSFSLFSMTFSVTLLG